MTENILKLVQPTEPTPCDDVLREASDVKMTEIVIVGYDGNGEFYYNASMAGAPEAIYLLQRAIHKMNCLVDRLVEEA